MDYSGKLGNVNENRQHQIWLRSSYEECDMNAQQQ